MRLESYAHRSLGSFNTIGLSLDGREPILVQTTRGKEGKSGAYRGMLEIDASGDQRFLNVRELWVHLTMTNGCGVATRTSNKLLRCEVEAWAGGP